MVDAVRVSTTPGQRSALARWLGIECEPAHSAALTRTTQLYDRRPDDVTLDEVERVLI